jgi:putative DNA primase/helicase
MIIENTREQREQREQSSDYALSNGSPSIPIMGNNENRLAEIENPLDVEPRVLEKIEITKRPCFMSHFDWFELTGIKFKPGLYLHHEYTNKNGEVINIEEWVCSPLKVCAITSSSCSNDFGRLLRFIDSNGKWHEWAMPMDMLKGSGDELRGELLNQGLIFHPKQRAHLTEYIMTERPTRRITAASNVGWHDTAFILPTELIGEGDVVFQSETAGENDFSISGSLEDWKQNIGRLCEDNIPLIVSISAALAGALLKPVNRQQGGGIHWVGDSSIGKSTTIEIAATVWGSPNFIRSWSATSNGLEGIAATRNDTCLMLDEINEASSNEIGKIVYMLTNGQGKQRAGRTGSARKIHRWRIMTISTGEKTLESIMKEAGKQVNSGQVVRLLNIPTTFEYGAFSNLHGFKDGRSLADHLKSSRLKYYGHVGKAFIQKLIHEKRDLSELLDEITKKFIEQTTHNLEKRAAAVFAVIALAGELGVEYDLLPWNKGSVLDAAYIAFMRWQKFQGVEQTEDQKILNAISDFIDKHGDSRFSAANESNEKTVYERAGWYKDTDDKGRIFMLTSSALQEAGGGYDRNRIIDTLTRYGWLVDKDADRSTKKTRVQASLKNLYHICPPQGGQ